MCVCGEDCPFDTLSRDIFYEIHITVKDADVEKFKDACEEIGVKPILLDLQKEGLFDLMTSSIIKTAFLEEAYNIATSIYAQLLVRNFIVIRSKIETVPWNPEISKCPNGYYETHLAIKCPDSMLPALKEIAILAKSHISKNIFKKIDDVPVYMVTYRTYSQNIKLHENYVNIIKKALGEFEITKVISEFCVFDSNLDHDNEWIK